VKYRPREYQRIAIDHLLNRNRAALFARPGMGKTSVVVSVLDTLFLIGESRPALVLAPKRVAIHTWPKEIKKWDDFRHLDISPIVGTPQERLAALKRDVPIYTTNYEQLPWLIEHFGDRWPFATVIADESTKLKNLRVSVRRKKDGSTYIQNEGGSKRAGALAKIAFKHIDRIYTLTGTPVANGLKDLWGQTFFLDHGKRLGRSYGAFEDRWFERVMRHPNDRFGELRPREGATEEINERLADLCLALDPKDWFPDLLAPLTFRVEVELPAAARKLYDKMEREMYIEIANTGVEVFTAGAKMMKCRQLAAGAVFTDADGTWSPVHDEKIDALEDIWEECGGMPLLVAYWFRPDLERLLKAYPDGVDLATTAGLKAFMEGRARFGFGHPQSIGHGFDGLQEITNIIVFFTPDYNLEYREQMIERVGPVRQLQSGFKRKVLIYDIVATGTIDEVVLDAVSGKCTLQEALFSTMKQKGFA